MEEDKVNPCITEVRMLWGLFKWKEVIHNYKRYGIGKFMTCSDTYHVHYECERCGARRTEKFVEKDTLILQGVSVEELESI
jgi:hypothetical protein